VLKTVDGSAIMPLLGDTVILGPKLLAILERGLESDILAVVEIVCEERVRDSSNRQVCLLLERVTIIGRMGLHVVAAVAPLVGVVQHWGGCVENVWQVPHDLVPFRLAEVPG